MHAWKIRGITINTKPPKNFIMAWRWRGPSAIHTQRCPERTHVNTRRHGCTVRTARSISAIQKYGTTPGEIYSSSHELETPTSDARGACIFQRESAHGPLTGGPSAVNRMERASTVGPLGGSKKKDIHGSSSGSPLSNHHRDILQ